MCSRAAKALNACIEANSRRLRWDLTAAPPASNGGGGPGNGPAESDMRAITAAMTDLTRDQSNLYAATIAGLIAIVASEIEDPETAEAIGQALATGALQLRVAIVITAETTAITAGIASASGPPLGVFTHEVRTIWPAEFAGAGEPRH